MNGTEVKPQSGLETLLRAFSGGFQGSKEQVVLFLILVFIIVAILVILAVLQARRAARRIRAHAAETFDIIARQHRLSRSERELADRLGDCCRPPERRHLVLVNHHVFNECVGIARERGEIPEVALAALRLKLGFVEIGPEEVPQSTAEIPRGSSILLVPGRGRSVKVRVRAQKPEGIAVASASGPIRLSLGTLLSAHFTNRSGLYTFETYVRELESDLIILDHSDDIRRTQRRRHYRKKTVLPVEVKDIAFEAAICETMIVDLSGAGAAVTNPEAALGQGMEIGLSFTLGEERFAVPGRVLYVSKQGRLAHIAFEKIAPAVQDRIIRLLLKPEAPQSD